MIVKTDFRIQELTDSIQKADKKNSEFRYRTDSAIEKIGRDMTEFKDKTESQIESMKQDLAKILEAVLNK